MEWFSERSDRFKQLLIVILVAAVPCCCCSFVLGYRLRWIFWQLGMLFN